MKKMSKLLVLVTSLLYLPNALANGTQPRWQMQCKPTSGSSEFIGGTMYAIGNSVAISVQVNYASVDLLCSFDGNCTGLLNGTSQVIPADDAKLFRGADSKVSGFSYGEFTFECK